MSEESLARFIEDVSAKIKKRRRKNQDFLVTDNEIRRMEDEVLSEARHRAMTKTMDDPLDFGF